MSQPLLTVIMPVYNMEAYLGRALDSLLKQEEPNFKLLIINDGSTDKTRQIAESYQNKFKYFTLINKPNGGLSSARNVGLSQVTTPYFTFHDGDDWVDPGYTAFFVQAFRDHPQVDLVSCGFWLDEKGQKKSKPVTSKHLAGFLNKKEAYKEITNVFDSPVKGYTWNKAYKLRIVKKHHLFFVADLSFMEDQVFNVEYVSRCQGFYYTSNPYYHYWQRPDSMVHKVNLRMIPDNFRANYRVWRCICESLAAEKAKTDLELGKKAVKRARLSKMDLKSDLDMKN